MGLRKGKGMEFWNSCWAVCIIPWYSIRASVLGRRYYGNHRLESLSTSSSSSSCGAWVYSVLETVMHRKGMFFSHFFIANSALQSRWMLSTRRSGNDNHKIIHNATTAATMKKNVVRVLTGGEQKTNYSQIGRLGWLWPLLAETRFLLRNGSCVVNVSGAYDENQNIKINLTKCPVAFCKAFIQKSIHNSTKIKSHTTCLYNPKKPSDNHFWTSTPTTKRKLNQNFHIIINKLLVVGIESFHIL
jgi:hypothetical protein